MIPAVPVESAEDLYEYAPCGYLSTLPDGTIARVNQTFLALVGGNRTELLGGQRVQDLMTVPGRAFYETHILPLLRLQGSVKEIACDLRRAGREPLPVLLNCSAVRGADGEPTHLRFTFFDATDRRRFENELLQTRHRAERFKAIVDASAEAIVSVDAAGLVQSWNGAAEKLFGHPAVQAIGRPLSAVIVPDDAPLDLAALLVPLRAGQAVKRDAKCTRPNGERIHVAITLSPHVEPPAELIGVSVIVHDNTEEARAQARLRESEELFRTIFELSPAGVVLIDPDRNTIVACNEEAARANGYTREEFVGRGVLDIVSPSIHGLSLQRRERILAGGGDSYDSRHVTKSGVERDVHVTVRMVSILGERRMISVWEDITVRRKAEMALRESQARLAMGVRVAGLALADIDYHSGQIQLSPEAARLFGLGEQAMSVPRETLHATFHPDDRAEVLRQIEATLDPAGDGWFAMELRVVWPSGEVRWLRVRKQVFFSEGEGRARHPVGALIAALDVSAEKVADEAVRTSEQRFRSIFDNAAVGIAHVSLDARFMRVNPKFCAITGYAADELMSMTVDQITHPQDQATDVVMLRRLRRGETETYAREKRYVRKDGRIVWASLTVSMLRTTAGEPLYFIASVEDITERKAALEAVEQQRRFIERLTEVVPSILYVFDLDAQRHVWVNRQAGAALGYPPQDAGQWGPDLRMRNIHPDDLAQVTGQLPALASLGEGQTLETEFRLRHHDGGWRWFRSRETVFKRDGDGRVLEVIGVASDIDASKRAEESMREADRKKDAFIATLAHELRNPLAPIRNAVRLLRRQGPADPELQRCRDIIDRQVAQMAHLLDDLLDVSRITQGRLALRREPLDLAQVVEHALEIAQPVVEARGHALTVRRPDQTLVVDGDLTRLAQIFSNLLINAAKYTPDGGQIMLAVAQEAGDVVVRVRDNGAGIAADHLLQVFEMFSRGKSAEVSAQDGLGIGLSLVKGLVELHGGSVSASSGGAGQGSEFLVRLPLAGAMLPTPRAPASYQDADLPAPRKSLRVLVADDSVDIADTMQMLLELEGFDVEVAYDGEQALERAASFLPDVMLCDLGMPRMNGYEVARRLRAQPWGAHLTLIAQTGWGHESDRRRTREAGFDHHMVKPVDPNALCELLHGLARRAMHAD
jgi:PAS domain S-box-containing protein